MAKYLDLTNGSFLVLKAYECKYPVINNEIKIKLLNTSPLGRKSSPTIDSNSELLPALYEPITAIRGKSICLSSPTSLSESIIVINFFKFSKSPTPDLIKNNNYNKID